MATSYIEKALAPFQRLLSDDIVELVVNPDGGLWTELRGDAYMIRRGSLEPAAVREAVQQIAAEGGVRVSEKHPLGSVSFEYAGWLIRAQVVEAPVVRGGDALALRFFKPETEAFEPRYLVGQAQSASAMRRALVDHIASQARHDLQGALKVAVEAKLNIVVAGGTSSGKTTLARWLVRQVDARERVLTIEDVPDLMPTQANKLMMISRRESDVRSPDKLLQASLRLRPDRIILSEVTGADAYTFLKAINTGHGGSMTTIHADTAELAIERLAQTALEAPGKMTYRDMISYVTRSIDVIVHMGKENGARGVNEVFLPRDYGGGADMTDAKDAADDLDAMDVTSFDREETAA
ncbi:ATPase, T2SS/T4P/T4SS family [Jannaschia aquimarina]|uniref:Type IV secretion system protein VirB11 n=1 Tax=Jannaschia aquimarina TaxID=935700 RepID=A0A0D1D9J5_9RHOB|nr:ATPase, T2SS/T4P/T4SS family [Jannaschia aquimarina]KIT16568.1 Type IV secretion system protein VirB11 [Jannaschia aquimarina]SNT41720.1 type IV secretion system protein VirB11 [Jannaschia aquimarina]